jgi:alkylation response protein AidB-like acyl-CoA dehydrogenase
VPASAVVGTAGGAADAVERLWHTACVLQCAETVGAADYVLGMTLAYLGDRYSFGRPLSSYQALKHRLADDKMWLEACHATSTAAARAGHLAAGAGGRQRPKAWIGPRAAR